MLGASEEQEGQAVSTISLLLVYLRPSSSRVPSTRRSGLESAFGRVAEFVLHRGHRDITRVTLAGADRDARRCLCIAARALHLALSCESVPSCSLSSCSLFLARALLLRSDSFVRSFFLSSAPARASLCVIVTDESLIVTYEPYVVKKS